MGEMEAGHELGYVAENTVEETEVSLAFSKVYHRTS